MLARAIAGESNAAFFSISPSDILSKFVGESEAAVKNIFRKAVDHALYLESKCAVIFFDEIDALGQSRDGSRGGEGDGCSRRVLAELLLQLTFVAAQKNRLSRFADQRTDSNGDITNPLTPKSILLEF
jgi:SpoVK/Ycf46/Vps4 family AAA+-type ATPase